jgi:hypothetical protein
MDDADRDFERFKAELDLTARRFEATVTANQALWQEQQVRDREVWLFQIRTKLLMFKVIIDFALLAIRSLIIVNGGAIVGVVSFTGNLWSRDNSAAKAAAQALGPTLGWFIAGLSCALLTAGISYMSQVAFAEMKSQKPAQVAGNVLRVIAMLAAIASLVCFVTGARVSLGAFTL